MFYMACLGYVFHECSLKPFHFLRADFGDANCKRQLKFVDIGLEPDENGMRSNHGVESTKNFATASGNQVSLQSEGRKESSCNDQESSAGLGSLNALEETPLASSTPCTLMENSEEMDAKVQVSLRVLFFLIILQPLFLENNICHIWSFS